MEKSDHLGPASGGKHWRLLSLALVLTALPELTRPQPADANSVEITKTKPLTETLTVGEEIFTVELALTPKSRERGLMFRKALAPNSGMLFVFADDRIHSFWMFNTLIDLDIIFLNKTGHVTALHTMKTEPQRSRLETEIDYGLRLPRYSSRRKVRYALEFAAGTLELLTLKPGDLVPLDFDRLQRLGAKAVRDAAKPGP